MRNSLLPGLTSCWDHPVTSWEKALICCIQTYHSHNSSQTGIQEKSTFVSTSTSLSGDALYSEVMRIPLIMTLALALLAMAVLYNQVKLMDCAIRWQCCELKTNSCTLVSSVHECIWSQSPFPLGFPLRYLLRWRYPPIIPLLLLPFPSPSCRLC